MASWTDTKTNGTTECLASGVVTPIEIFSPAGRQAYAKITGLIKKFDPQGFGIIETADGSKLPFILSDFARNQLPQKGQKVVFSIRRVKDKVFASNVVAGRDGLNAF